MKNQSMSNHNHFHQAAIDAVHFVVNHLIDIGFFGGAILGISFFGLVEELVLKFLSVLILPAISVCSAWAAKRWLLPILDKKFPKEK